MLSKYYFKNNLYLLTSVNVGDLTDSGAGHLPDIKNRLFTDLHKYPRGYNQANVYRGSIEAGKDGIQYCFDMEVHKMLAAIEWDNLIFDPVRQMLTKIMAYLPVLLGALLILIVGWIVAKIIRWIVDGLLKAIRFDTLADKAGISEVLRKGNLKTSAREVISGLVYWLVIIMVLVMVVNALGLPNASEVLSSLFAYVPKVIAALLVLVVAIFLANFVSGLVQIAAGNANLPKPALLAGISRWAIIIFAVTISLTQLGIAPLLVTATFNIILGGIVLALALAFGLGGKDAAARYLEELKQKRSGK